MGREHVRNLKFCRMRSLKGVDHPNVWKLLSDIKEEDMLARLDILNTGNGNPPVKRVRQIYLDLQTRLRNLCEERAAGAGNLDDFLRAVGRNLRWKAPIHQMEN